MLPSCVALAAPGALLHGDLIVFQSLSFRGVQKTLCVNENGFGVRELMSTGTGEQVCAGMSPAVFTGPTQATLSSFFELLCSGPSAPENFPSCVVPNAHRFPPLGFLDPQEILCNWFIVAFCCVHFLESC